MLPINQRREATAVVRHEFGHLVAAKALGFRTGSVSINPTSAAAAIDIFPAVGEISKLRAFLENRIRVLFAGAYAQGFTGAKFDEQLISKLFTSTAADDFTKIRENLRILAGTYFTDEVSEKDFQKKLTELQRRLEGSAFTIVKSNKTLIHDLAVYFMKKWDLHSLTASNAGQFEMPANEIDNYAGVSEVLPVK